MSALEVLSDRCGIGRDYLDFRHQPVEVPHDSRMAILAALGYPDTEEGASVALARFAEEDRRALPRTLVLRSDEPLAFPLRLPATGGDWRLRLRYEQGGELCLVPAADSLEQRFENTCPEGYHHLQLVDESGGVNCECQLLVAPRTAFQPQALADGGKLFGVGVQLYAVRSGRNWGIGDFTDLEVLIRDSAAAGVDVIGLNPLHALYPANPRHFSPYSPSNRGFLNVMYIDPARVPGYSSCREARDKIADEAFQQHLDELREAHHVDYQGVADCKLPVLEMLYQAFVSGASDADRQAFAAYCEAQGEALHQHALYDALQEYFLQQDLQLWGWPVWPQQYQDPASTTVAAFAAANADRVGYFKFLQWCAHQQLEAAQDLAMACGMAVGIYLDLAVGADQGGSEVWANQSAFCLSASAGAPPDELARSGQDWGFPPLTPEALKTSAYRLFVDNLRANMSVSGAVRFDHAVSLQRLWWIPKPGSAEHGAYVNYPLHDLLGVLALESRRNRCLVIGEDLGTVPPELTAMMERNHLYSYKVLYFEKAGEQMKHPADYPREAVATVTTHDLPTLASWWDGSDIELRAELGLLGTEATAREMREARVHDRQRLLDALVAEGCWKGERDAAAIGDLTAELNLAVHRFLGCAQSAVMIVQIEDLMGMLAPTNVPGTSDSHRNWQRKLRWPLEGLFHRELVSGICGAVRDARRDGVVSD